MEHTDRDEIAARILQAAAAMELDAELGERPGEVVVVLPGEKKLKTVVSLLVGAREVSLRVPPELAAKLKGPVRIRYSEDREVGGGTIDQVDRVVK